MANTQIPFSDTKYEKKEEEEVAERKWKKDKSQISLL